MGEGGQEGGRRAASKQGEGGESGRPPADEMARSTLLNLRFDIPSPRPPYSTSSPHHRRHPYRLSSQLRARYSRPSSSHSQVAEPSWTDCPPRWPVHVTRVAACWPILQPSARMCPSATVGMVCGGLYAWLDLPAPSRRRHHCARDSARSCNMRSGTRCAGNATPAGPLREPV